ncbi:phosphoenolpyruvate synthase [Methyloligella sp. 2.7D]|uniref:phosphoenolpyruvate synthase n=1 Tax=unclassified Methyloligella TaxID=2625955 RepID=UPI00157DC467|nr:phosphoenolpyruvate synthase [Methyloligella sp. GL2]QKP78100.1 phosphoenolpyruvate synthase [Methyloligella sp. GL2]
MNDQSLVIPLSEIARSDVAKVGGKNSSLGELIGHLQKEGINVPGGFATTSDAFWMFIKENRLHETIAAEVAKLGDDLGTLAEVGSAIRKSILDAPFPPALKDAILGTYDEMRDRGDRTVAVRSSATAEDLPEASFAGQLESYLNIEGEEALLDACRKCYASLFTDRAISYRENHGFDHLQVAVSVGVQKMVRSDLASSGVMFSIDTETGFPRSILITGVWGLGETIVQGMVDPDEFQVYKPFLDREDLTPIIHKSLGVKRSKMIYAKQGSTVVVETERDERRRFVLDDDEILTLARWAATIERHYGCPMDMEWAKDGETGELYIVQARPETVQSRREASALHTYKLKGKGELLFSGLAIGDAIGAGKVCKLQSPDEIESFPRGAVLVTATTGPDWVPIMTRAAAIITDHGGRTSHAAIVSREIGLPAIVGAGDATKRLEEDQPITVSCAEGSEGHVYEGIAEFEKIEIEIADIPETRTKAMLNLADPAGAFRWWRLPADGVGLARMEFIIGRHIQIHPMALIRFDEVEDEAAKTQIAKLTRGYPSREEYFIDKLSRGMARIAAAHHPNPVIVRMSDFKTNEYADLLGGAQFEPHEENPMLGWRGASRYYDPAYREGFGLECQALARARNEIGMDNIVMMIPFCRTLAEADKVIAEMAKHGLERGKDGLKLYVMAEIPANVKLAEKFAERFDGFSIGSNDLTQLTLGVDRDSDRLTDLFDERNEAVLAMIEELLEKAQKTGSHTGLCGQAPSDHPEFARFLVEKGIDSMSVSPDRFVRVKEQIAAAEAHLGIAPEK